MIISSMLAHVSCVLWRDALTVPAYPHVMNVMKMTNIFLVHPLNVRSVI